MESTDDRVVTCEIDGALARLTINRPEARNALNRAVFEGLEVALDAVVATPEVSAIILTGAGDRAFCAGADLDELRDLSGIEARALLGTGQRVLRRIETLGIPTVAAVRGWAVGGGFELALACPLVVAGASARFAFPEAGLGLMPGYGGTQRLTHAVGAKTALSLMLTGESLDAKRAWDLGLLARPPVDDDSLADAAMDLAMHVASRSASAIGLILEGVAAALPVGEGLRHETALAALATSSPDALEGIAAFLDKRTPAFAGRSA
jgi:enoyl-CoA hydratase